LPRIRRPAAFILLNRAGEEFLGIPCAAIIGKTDHDFFPKEKADRFIARDRRALQSRLPQAVEEEPQARLRLGFSRNWQPRVPSLSGRVARRNLSG